jgi:N-acetylmuramoyl-L-alanine amidase
MNNPEYIIVHTAAAGDWNLDDDSEYSKDVHIDPSAEDIRRFHIKVRGWRDIGYHYVIRKDGTLERGRDERTIGAHTKGLNANSIGVCFSGHHNRELWTDAQDITFWRLFNDIYTRYSIPVSRTIGHRETGAVTDCPGTRIDMNEIRKQLYIRRAGTI